jgi:hypothetical protein
MNNTRIFAFAGSLLMTASAAFAADFSNYVAMGDSLTAGWQSGCLVDRHQLKSYPAVLAGQFGTTVAGVGDTSLAHFQQPLVSEPGVPQPCSTLTFDPATGEIGIDQHLGEAPGAPENLLLPRPYNNLGIPGSHSYDMLDVTHSTGTDIFSLVLRNFPGSPLDGTNAVEQAIAQNPTFLTVFIGNQDTLDASGTATVKNDSCLGVNPAGGGSPSRRSTSSPRSTRRWSRRSTPRSRMRRSSSSIFPTSRRFPSRRRSPRSSSIPRRTNR